MSVSNCELHFVLGTPFCVMCWTYLPEGSLLNYIPDSCSAQERGLRPHWRNITEKPHYILGLSTFDNSTTGPFPWNNDLFWFFGSFLLRVPADWAGERSGKGTEQHGCWKGLEYSCSAHGKETETLFEKKDVALSQGEGPLAHISRMFRRERGAGPLPSLKMLINLRLSEGVRSNKGWDHRSVTL